MSFHRDAGAEPIALPACSRRRLYWVHDPVSNQFGPGKFVGLADVPLADYAEALGGVTGTQTRLAIEQVLAGTLRSPARSSRAPARFGANR